MGGMAWAIAVPALVRKITSAINLVTIFKVALPKICDKLIDETENGKCASANISHPEVLCHLVLAQNRQSLKSALMTQSSVLQLPKRFYKTATVSEADGGFGVLLDERPVRTPAGAALSLPTRALAEAIASEWAAQDELIDIPNMTLTRLANVAIDRTPETRAALADEVVNYCGTDLLCHLAEAPATLVEKQEASWRPVRDWAGKTLDVVLVPVAGIVAVPQPPASLEAAGKHAAALDDFRLTGLAHALGLYGSALLALAVEQDELTAMDALEMSRIDEVWQAEQWGVDEEAREAYAARKHDAEALAEWFDGLRG